MAAHLEVDESVEAVVAEPRVVLQPSINSTAPALPEQPGAWPTPREGADDDHYRPACQRVQARRAGATAGR